LSINLEHTTAIIHLPFYHRDPFDRLLFAQAQVEKLPFISADPIFDNYGVQRAW
jgi:PIN domain nuclease of toxin-antitoxin system